MVQIKFHILYFWGLWSLFRFVLKIEFCFSRCYGVVANVVHFISGQEQTELKRVFYFHSLVYSLLPKQQTYHLFIILHACESFCKSRVRAKNAGLSYEVLPKVAKYLMQDHIAASLKEGPLSACRINN